MHPFITVAIFIGTTMMANGQKRLSCNSNDQPVSKIAYSAGSLSGFYNLAKGFIHLVQKSDIPYDKMQALKDYVDDGTDHSAKEIMDKVNPILVYEAGLIALLAIGILYCALMPLVGAIFCCCRCCGNCGGKRYQEAPVSTSYCFAYIAVLIAIFAFMLTGCLLYGLNNNKAWHEVPKLRDNVNTQLGIVNDFIENTQTSIDCTIAGEFDDLGTMAAQQIGDISGSVSDQIIQQTGFSDFLNLQTKLSNVSQTALQFSAAVNATSKAANDFLTNFDNYNKTYPNSISSSDMETVHREIGNFSEYPALISTPINGYLSYSDSFSQQIIQVQRNLNVTSGDVSKYTSTVTGQITSANETVQTSVNDFKSKSEQLRDNIKDAQDNINDNLSDDNLDKWSWSQYTLLVFIVPIAFILLCLAFGLVCGIVGYKASRKPYERSSLSGLGGACLMVAVVLAFIFAWILMLITMTFFSVGFLTETLVCKGVFYNSGNDMFNFIEKNWGENINADNFTVNISLLVNTCKSNGTLYNALNVQQVLNLEDIRGTVKNIADNIDINQILKFDTGSVYVANTDQLQELAGYLRNLSNILDKLAFNYPYQTAEILKKINPHNASSQQDVFNTLNQTFIYLVASISTTNSTYKEMQNLLQETANLTDSLRLSRNQTINPSTIIANANQTAIVKVGTAQDELNSFVDDFIRRVEYETAKCAPLYQVYQNVGDILCKQAMNPIQAIWLSLGWCLLFFIPMIVIAVKLEKYFRRMDVQLYVDVNQPFTSVSYDKKSSKEPITSITYGWDIPDRIPRAKPHQVGPA